MNIRPFVAIEREQVEILSLAAWEPVFHSFERVLGPEIYHRIYPEWRTQQAEAVTDCCTNPKHEAWIAEDEDGTITGFIVWEANQETKEGEVHMLAVHPGYQRRGIGTALNELALAKLKEAGMHLVAVGTGGDPGHAPARAAYEKVGYTALPLVRYYKAL